MLSIFPAFRSLPHACLFGLGFLACEVVGLIRLTWLWLTSRHHTDYLPRNQQVQYWWSSKLLNMGRKIFALKFAVTGDDVKQGGSVLMLARHTSIADTVLPMIYFAQARGEGMRYVLKKELAVLPCLDIAGHRLPNLFVDRSGLDSEAERQAVRRLTAEAGTQESVLIYPEGTRATEAKRAKLSRASQRLSEQLKRWPDLLPPRLGGVCAMLAANPGKDIMCLAHVGFEGSASLRDFINGSWRGQTVRLHFWRIPYADVPNDHTEFVFDLWDQMQFYVSKLVSGGR